MILIKLCAPAGSLCCFVITDRVTADHSGAFKRSCRSRKKRSPDFTNITIKMFFPLDSPVLLRPQRDNLKIPANDYHLTQFSAYAHMPYPFRSADKADDKRLFSCSLYLRSLAWNSLAASVVIMAYHDL